MGVTVANLGCGILWVGSDRVAMTVALGRLSMVQHAIECVQGHSGIYGVYRNVLWWRDRGNVLRVFWDLRAVIRRIWFELTLILGHIIKQNKYLELLNMLLPQDQVIPLSFTCFDIKLCQYSSKLLFKCNINVITHNYCINKLMLIS